MLKKLTNLFYKCLSSLLLLLPVISHAAITPPPADVVFQFNIMQLAPRQLNLQWIIKPGFYLYRDRIHIAASKNVILDSINLPSGTILHDEILGDHEVYSVQQNINVPIASAPAGQHTLVINYQGCAASGFCYPPIKQTIAFTWIPAQGITNVMPPQTGPGQVITAPSSSNHAISPPPEKTSFDLNSSSAITDLLAKHNFALSLIVFLGLGLLLTFTPCVLPMIPIVTSIIVGQGQRITTTKALRLSLTYVLAMATTYAGLGIAAALLGQSLQAALQTPWALGLVSTLLIIMALALFDICHIPLPNTLTTGITKLSQRQRGGTYIGVAIMGILATLIVSPCITPPLIGALTYIAHTQDLVFGGTALFMLGLGMGIPLIAVATLGGNLLPRSGGWMRTIKHLFGVMLLAVVISLLSRIVAANIINLLWITLLVFTSVLLSIESTKTQLKYFIQQFIALAILIYSVMLAHNVYYGIANIWRPFPKLAQTLNETPTLEFRRIKTLTELNQVLQQAQLAGNPLMLDFYADWCVACKIMERTTFTDSQVQQRLNEFILLQVDVTANSEEDIAILRHFKVIAPPTILFFNGNINESSEARLVGEITANQLLQHLDKHFQTSTQ
ncbi:MAG: protein-disulfide reductase DsbD [Gammaproteobacteria bacterium]